MFGKVLLAFVLLALVPGEEAVSPDYYVDMEDTSSFRNAHLFEHGVQYGMDYAEVYGINDNYDYLKYVAPYSRCVYLAVLCTDDCSATIDVFVTAYSQVTPYFSYSSSECAAECNAAYVEKDTAVYYRIRCNGNCWWEAHLLTNPMLSGATYRSYEKFYGYDMPHSGPAFIYYDYGDEMNELVPGLNCTWADMIDSAIYLWEACGEVQFVFSHTQKYFTIELDPTITMVDVYHAHHILSNNYYTSDFIVSSNMDFYDQAKIGLYNWDGSPCSLWQSVLGNLVIGFGLALGLVINYTNLYRYNMMHAIDIPYDELGDGDIGSFIALWGDSTLNITGSDTDTSSS